MFTRPDIKPRAVKNLPRSVGSSDVAANGGRLEFIAGELDVVSLVGDPFDEILVIPMAQFYESVIKHGPNMMLTPEEWFDFLSRIPARVLRDERKIMNELSVRSGRSCRQQSNDIIRTLFCRAVRHSTR